MEIINFAEQNSIVNDYMCQLRDRTVQTDPMRFRLNVRRIGHAMAYEISKNLNYAAKEIQTPLAPCTCQVVSDKVVLGTILRAGLTLHEGFLDVFDNAENAFVSAFRKYRNDSDDFTIVTEYLAAPSLEGKTLIICDPMLATGRSMDVAYQAMLSHGTPAKIHIASVIASQQAVDYVKEHFPADKTTLWVAAIDDVLNAHSYIVPGLGDAGDLLFGDKL